MHRLAILIDGGHLRVLARIAQKPYNPSYVEKIAHACVGADEELIRVLYYDCAPYNGDVQAPVSQATISFTKGDS